mmetsp:Transcript_32096/g.79543  ORF Transcript_32096/g.79543 Transcript_32096/m.79543 type:complete len:509 (+) Transcript_32096:159-1685(+)
MHTSHTGTPLRPFPSTHINHVVMPGSQAGGICVYVCMCLPTIQASEIHNHPHVGLEVATHLVHDLLCVLRPRLVSLLLPGVGTSLEGLVIDVELPLLRLARPQVILKFSVPHLSAVIECAIDVSVDIVEVLVRRALVETVDCVVGEPLLGGGPMVDEFNEVIVFQSGLGAHGWRRRSHNPMIDLKGQRRRSRLLLHLLITTNTNTNTTVHLQLIGGFLVSLLGNAGKLLRRLGIQRRQTGRVLHLRRVTNTNTTVQLQLIGGLCRLLQRTLQRTNPLVNAALGIVHRVNDNVSRHPFHRCVDRPDSYVTAKTPLLVGFCFLVGLAQTPLPITSALVAGEGLKCRADGLNHPPVVMLCRDLARLDGNRPVLAELSELRLPAQNLGRVAAVAYHILVLYRLVPAGDVGDGDPVGLPSAALWTPIDALELLRGGGKMAAAQREGVEVPQFRHAAAHEDFLAKPGAAAFCDESHGCATLHHGRWLLNSIPKPHPSPPDRRRALLIAANDEPK